MSSDSTFGWALVGPGRIARRFAGAVAGIDGAAITAVVSRDAARARAFAAEAAPGAWCGDNLAEALARPDVQAVYVCTPHPLHALAVRAALEAGKPVLCEKPMTPTAPATRELVALARARGVFLMEGIWTRFLPIYAQVRQWLADGRIGAVRAMQSSFLLERPPAADLTTDRRYAAALGGGTLLDIGIYNITASRIALPDVPVAGFDAHAWRNEQGVDVQLQANIDFGEGRFSQFVCGWFTTGPNRFLILGERGHLVVHGGFWEATTATLNVTGQAPETVERPFRVNGFEYEVEEAMRCIRAGLTESPLMPLSETLAVVELMDAMRARIGVRYPFE